MSTQIASCTPSIQSYFHISTNTLLYDIERRKKKFPLSPLPHWTDQQDGLLGMMERHYKEVAFEVCFVGSCSWYLVISEPARLLSLTFVCLFVFFGILWSLALSLRFSSLCCCCCCCFFARNIIYDVLISSNCWDDWQHETSIILELAVIE